MTPRVFLFAPASDARKVHKAVRSGAHVVVLDLEDGVAPAQKEVARRGAVSALRERASWACQLAVRVNPAGTQDGAADLDAIGADVPDWLIVPKVESASNVRAVRERLAGTAQGTRPAIVATVETPRGVLDADSICRAEPELRALLFGAGDLSAALGIRESPSRAELDHPRSHVALVAAAAGLLAIDCPFYQDLSDLDALRADAARGRQLGYGAKAVIHPDHLAVVRRAFAPSADDVAWAHAVVESFQRAGAAGMGATSAAGSMVDEPIVEQARAILAEAQEAADAAHGAGRAGADSPSGTEA